MEDASFCQSLLDSVTHIAIDGTATWLGLGMAWQPVVGTAPTSWGGLRPQPGASRSDASARAARIGPLGR